MTATPPLKMRPRVNAGSGIGNCTADRTPGIVRIASKSYDFTSPPYTGHAFTAAHFIPGNRTSIPYTTSPVTLGGMSRFFCSVPISVHWSGGLMVIVSGCGCGVSAARWAIWP